VTVGTPGVTHNDPENGLAGLDTGYPYPVPAGTPAYTEAGPKYQTNDNPSLGLKNAIGSAIIQHQFTDYLMYQPPAAPSADPNYPAVMWVPLGQLSWSPNGNATIPPSGLWSDYVATYGSDSAGTVTPTAKTNFTAGNTFPSWTRINIFPSF